MTLQAVFHQAVTLHQNGQLAEAEKLYRQILASDPKVARGHYLLAVLHFQQQRFAEALPAVETALALDPRAVEALALRGVILQATGHYGEALASFDKALALAPGNDEIWYNRGLVLVALKRFAEALAAFERALALKPDSVDACYNRGLVLLELKRYAEALAAFDRALLLAPNAVELWNNRGAALGALQRFDEEVASYDKALAIDPSHAQSWNNRGGALAGQKRFGDAVASYDRAVALDPGYINAWNNRAAALHSMRRFEEALAATDKALAIHPDDPEALITKAQILCEANRISEGVAIFRRRAKLLYASEPVTADDLAHRQRHDAEQRDYLAAQGIAVADGTLHFEGGARLAGPAVNPANAENIAVQWHQNRPQIVVIDNLLTGEALEELRRFCWGSTVWRRSYVEGYLGAMPESGFACPLLAQIAEELRDIFPTIFGEHGLRLFWGFKYDSDLRGIRIHADQAAVNVNFWITPDEANRNPDNGGLVIWDVSAPLDWESAKYNGDEDAARNFLAREGAKPVTVPYRANRAVIFDSDLFHETDTIEFKDGYRNRRINITMLYGRRNFEGS